MKKNKTSPYKATKAISKRHYSFLYSPRCDAKTRKGTPCKAPAVKGKKRCRMHGGSKGSGAQKGNQNALKHGMTTCEMKSFVRQARDILRKSKSFIEDNL